MIRKITAVCAITILALSSSFAAAVDANVVNAAIKQSEASKKPLLFLFTGSDWCPGCKMLESRVLQSEEWKNYASEKATFLVYDSSPRPFRLKALTIDGKDVRASGEDFTKQISELASFAEKHQVVAYPTVFAYNAETKTWRQIELSLNPKTFINSLEAAWGVK